MEPGSKTVSWPSNGHLFSVLVCASKCVSKSALVASLKLIGRRHHTSPTKLIRPACHLHPVAGRPVPVNLLSPSLPPGRDRSAREVD